MTEPRRFSVGPLHFLRRPMSTPAEEGTIALLDGLTAKGNPSRRVGSFQNGKWKTRGSAGFVPQYWITFLPQEGGHG